MSELTKQSAEQATKPSSDSALSAIFGDELAKQGKGRAAVPKLTGFTAKGATEVKEKSRTSDAADLSAQTATDTGKPKAGPTVPKLTGFTANGATEMKEKSLTSDIADLSAQTATDTGKPKAGLTVPKLTGFTAKGATEVKEKSRTSDIADLSAQTATDTGKPKAGPTVPKLTGFTVKGATEVKEKSRTSDTADLSAQTATDTGKPKAGMAIPKLTGFAPKHATEKKEASTTEAAARLYSQTAPYRDVPVPSIPTESTPKPGKVVVPPPNPTELLKPVERKKVKRGEPLAVTSGQCDLVQVTIKGNPHPLLLKESKSQGGQLKAGDDLKWEAAILAKLDHPCIMKIHGYLPADGEQQEGILIQKVENAKSSKDRAAGWKKELNTGEKTPAKVVGFLTKTLQPICQALEVVEAMEKQNLVHNDLNPENLLINDKGELTVIDFGSARPQGQSVKKCAEFYGAPELEEAAITGQGGCTSKSDVFSLGRVIATTIQEGDLKLNGDSEAAKEIAVQVSQLAALRKSMSQTKPADRPTAAEAKAALKKILDDLRKIKV